MIVDDYWSLMIDHDWWSLMIVDDYWSLMIIDDHWWLLSKSRWQGLLNCYFSPPMNWVGYFVLLKRCLNVVVLVSPPRDRTIQSYIYIHINIYIYLHIIYFTSNILWYVSYLCLICIYIYVSYLSRRKRYRRAKMIKITTSSQRGASFCIQNLSKKRSVYFGSDNPSITSASKRATATFSHIEDHRA